jgi:hypothetical protein
MAAVAAVAVGIILANESLWELQVKETPVVVQTVVVTELVAVAVARLQSVEMLVISILVATVGQVLRQRLLGLPCPMAVAAAVALMPTAAVIIRTVQALEALVVAVTAAALATAVARISTVRRALPILAAAAEVLILNQLLPATADQESSSCVTLLLRYQHTLVCQPLVALHALPQH